MWSTILQVGRGTRSLCKTNPPLHSKTQQTCLFRNSPSSCRDAGHQPMPVAYYYQNPWNWLAIKWRLHNLRKWDKNFTEKEFKTGSTYAITSVTSIVNNQKLDNLEGLLTPQALAKLRRDILVLWNNDIIKHIGLRPTDIKLAVPTNVHCRTFPLTGKRFCDIDMWYMAMKWKDYDALLIMDLVARFSRDYTEAHNLSDWTISFFELRKYHVQSYNR